MVEQIIKNFPFYKTSLLQKILTEDNVWFSKSRSQNFLVDKNYIYKIFENLKEFKDREFLEIGGGSGNISVILASIAKKLTIVELDNYFSYILSYIFNEDLPDWQSKYKFENYLKDFKNLIKKYLKENSTETEAIRADFLNFQYADKIESKKLIIFGNIPYNISTKILLKIIKIKKSCDSIFLTTQKEYFERIKGRNEKSFLTILLSYHFNIFKIFEIPPTAFFPKPKVYSTFFKLIPKENIFDEIKEKSFFSFVSKSFSNKRKKFINNFKEDKQVSEKLNGILEKNGFSVNIRADQLNLEEFITIFNQLNNTI